MKPWILLLAFAPGAASAAAPERPEHHMYRTAWWERAPRVEPMPEPGEPPEDPSYHMGEYEQAEGVLLTAWPTGTYGDLSDTYVPLLVTLKDLGVPVTVCKLDLNTTIQAKKSVEAAGYDPDELADWVSCDLDSIWMRDFGPFMAQTPDLQRVVGDGSYYPGREADDSFPQQFGSWSDVPVYGIPLEFEGGNFFADGEGNCVSTTIVPWYNSMDEEEVAGIFRDYLGCTQTILLEPLEGEGTGHVDMFFAPVDRTNVILGSYDPEYDPTNAALLDENAAELEAAGYTVHRVPMPGYEDGNGDGWEDFRTYINGLHVRTADTHIYLVPVYTDDTEYEEEALAAIADAMPGVEIVPIDSTELITWAGAVHCITKMVPVESWPLACEDAWDFNDEGCFPEPEPEPEPEEKSGLFACATGPAAPGLLLPLVLLAVRRRRTVARPVPPR